MNSTDSDYMSPYGYQELKLLDTLRVLDTLSTWNKFPCPTETEVEGVSHPQTQKLSHIFTFLLRTDFYTQEWIKQAFSNENKLLHRHIFGKHRQWRESGMKGWIDFRVMMFVSPICRDKWGLSVSCTCCPGMRTYLLLDYNQILNKLVHCVKSK